MSSFTDIKNILQILRKKLISARIKTVQILKRIFTITLYNNKLPKHSATLKARIDKREEQTHLTYSLR